jgi:GTPase
LAHDLIGEPVSTSPDHAQKPRSARPDHRVMSFTVAIVGRPNVGKSTLFNRLVGSRLALVDDQPGVTRDRREGKARLGDLDFTIVDTAGLEDARAESLPGRMRAQTEAALLDADAILFLIDARSGLLPADRGFADLMRRSGKPVIVVANKSEGKAGEAGVTEAYALGLGEPVAISAEHGEGLSTLYDALRAALPEQTELPETEENETPAPETEVIRVAVVGRPNAGKSTLINRLLGEERLLTGPEPGITRDSISVPLQWQGRDFLIYDTAGMRRRSKIDEKLEKLSVADALNAIRFAHVVVVMMDSQHAFEEQDLRIADLVEREGRALVIAMSKSDLMPKEAGALKKVREETDHWLPQVKGVPVVAVSGLTGEGVDRLLRAVTESHAVWNRRVPTAALNRWLGDTLAQHPPPAVSGRRLKLNYITQPKTRPPSFILSCTRADALPDAYRRYLINGLRETFGLPGTPIRLTLREKENPFARRRKRQR